MNRRADGVANREIGEGPHQSRDGAYTREGRGGVRRHDKTEYIKKEACRMVRLIPGSNTL